VFSLDGANLPTRTKAGVLDPWTGVDAGLDQPSSTTRLARGRLTVSSGSLATSIRVTWKP
jgi:hypothetical protein